MDVSARIEGTLEAALAPRRVRGRLRPGPPTLAEAMHYAVFPGGHRIRPRLCLSVAAACGDSAPALADAAAAAIELLHCASLVHDDMPCFDGAETRRGRPSVHSAYGEPLALLVGDGLIVLAFEVLANAAQVAPERLAPLLRTVSAAVGAPCGIVAGQAWECEPEPDLRAYHRAKTGALFAGATVAGAVAAGFEPEGWYRLGARLGEAYQVADDLSDALASEEELGKPVGRDTLLDRPSAVRELGVEGASARLRTLVEEAQASIPDCPHRKHLCAAIGVETAELVQAGKARCAA
ncbi:MAG TPA: polyprenyl synthetase family protein [Pseudomonadales bacterium]|nr:polyprenyl synthetase family protein [Pseudomonadales bacterium]